MWLVRDCKITDNRQSSSVYYRLPLSMSTPLPSASSWEMLLIYLKRRRYVRVINESMIPTLSPGDVVVLNEYAYRHRPPQPGDVVVAEHPEPNQPRMIKRVESIYTDDRAVTHCFLMSDNANLPESRDSRTYGTFAAETIVGQVTGKLPALVHEG